MNFKSGENVQDVLKQTISHNLNSNSFFSNSFSPYVYMKTIHSLKVTFVTVPVISKSNIYIDLDCTIQSVFMFFEGLELTMIRKDLQ